MTRYLYSGPLTGADLADGRELMLNPGCEVDMDPSASLTQSLVALKRLVAVPEPPPVVEVPPVVIPGRKK